MTALTRKGATPSGDSCCQGEAKHTLSFDGSQEGLAGLSLQGYSRLSVIYHRERLAESAKEEAHGWSWGESTHGQGSSPHGVRQQVLYSSRGELG